MTTKNNKLETFATANGVPYEDAHSALSDATMTALALANFRAKMRNTKQRGKRVASDIQAPSELL